MLKIGDFSRLTRISIRMLRYYDEQNLLKPCEIDTINKYRYYDTEQIFLAFQINALKTMGFSTAAIKQVLIQFHEKDAVLDVMRIQLCNLQEEQEKIDEKIAFVQHAIQILDKEAMNMKYDVEVKMIEKRYMMCKRGIVPSYDKEHLLWEGLHGELQARNLMVEFPEHAQSRAYFYDEGFKEKDPDIEICVEVCGEYEDSEHLKFRWIPEVEVASITFKGGYEQCLETSLILATWINEHGYELAGPDFSIYHVGYGQSNCPEDFVTEVCFPIRKK